MTNVVKKVSINGQVVPFGGGGGSEWAEVVYLTQAEYDALPASKLTDGKIYKVKTSGSVPAPWSWTPIETISAASNTQYDIPVWATRISFISVRDNDIIATLNWPLKPFIDNAGWKVTFTVWSTWMYASFWSNKVSFSRPWTIYFY